MYKGQSVSVVISTYREVGSVREVIEEFFATGFVDEVVVVDNNAEIGTDEEIKKTRARLFHETRQGYGYGYRKGIAEAAGELVVLCEADGTFAGSDLERFLVFAQDFPVVLGSRTNQSAILDKKTMYPLRRYADVFYAKVLEVIFSTHTITDIGCTYKLFRRDVLKKLEPQFETTNSLFATELMLLTFINKIPFIEIPVSFRQRVGVSGTLPNFSKTAEWAVRIWLYIWLFWWKKRVLKSE